VNNVGTSHTHRSELGCARWTAEHDDCRNTEITQCAQDWQVSRRATVGACCGCLAACGVHRVINQTPGELAEGRWRGEEDGSCMNVTDHAVTNELGEEIVTAGEGVY
jgi:hypothetical protein